MNLAHGFEKSSCAQRQLKLSSTFMKNGLSPLISASAFDDNGYRYPLLDNMQKVSDFGTLRIKWEASIKFLSSGLWKSFCCCGREPTPCRTESSALLLCEADGVARACSQWLEVVSN